MRETVQQPKFEYKEPPWASIKLRLKVYVESLDDEPDEKKKKSNQGLIDIYSSQIALISMIQDLEKMIIDGVVDIKWHQSSGNFYVNIKKDAVFYNGLYSIIKYLEEHNITGQKGDLIQDAVYAIVHRTYDNKLERLMSTILFMNQIENALWGVYNAIAFEDKEDIETFDATEILSKEIDVLRDNLNEDEDELNRLTSVIDEKDAEITDRLNEIEQLNEDIENEKQKVETYKKDTTADISHLKSMIEGLTERIETKKVDVIIDDESDEDEENEYQSRINAAIGESKKPKDMSKLIKKLQEDGQLTTKEIQSYLKCKENKRIEFMKILEYHNLISIETHKKPVRINWIKPFDSL